jgi:hypothetical protein
VPGGAVEGGGGTEGVVDCEGESDTRGGRGGGGSSAAGVQVSLALFPERCWCVSLFSLDLRYIDCAISLRSKRLSCPVLHYRSAQEFSPLLLTLLDVALPDNISLGSEGGVPLAALEGGCSPRSRRIFWFRGLG